ncbi:MAG: alpha-amylase family glycosyl hydrolase [Actinomycetota bacterium]
MSESGERPTTDAWWRDALVYQVYVRSFADSDGDGIGDLPGIRSRLDQLAALGIDAIWLNPCFPSPQRDHGYDVSDYFAIHDEYGTLDDFDELLAAARDRGIKIMMDLVPNHCSSEHEWFRAALNAPPGSPERARFFFHDGLPNDDDPHGAPPNNWAAAFGGSAWTRASGDDPQWYLGTFTPHQPDLDHRNSDVMKMFADMLEFWFDRGVEGFRVDAIVPVGKHPDLPDQPPVPEGTGMLQVAWENPYNNFRPEGHEIWKEFREIVDDYERRHPGRSLPLVAEAYMNGRPDLVRQYVNDAEFHGAFAFDLMLARWTKPAIEQALSDTFDLIETGQTATWTLNNHDAQRVVKRLGRDNADADANAGENMLDVDWNEVVVDLGLRRSRALVSLMMAMPGAVYLYAGEELGLPEVLDIPADRREDPVFHQTGGQRIGRDGCRIPLPWTDDPATNFGFSTLPDGVQQAPEPWLPQPEWWGSLAVDEVDGQEGSTLELYRELVAARREHALPQGRVAAVVDLGPGLVAVRRGDLVTVTNVTRSPIALDLDDDHLEIATPVFSSAPAEMHTPGVIPPNCTIWFVS